MFQSLGGERQQRSSRSSRVGSNRSGQSRAVEPGRAVRRRGAPFAFLCLAAIAIFGLSGCGGKTVPQATTPHVSIVMNQTPPATVNPSATVTVAAVVSNDPSNEGVDWQLICSYNTGASSTNSGYCGSGPGGKGTYAVSSWHTASGTTTTYTAPAYYPGGTVTLYARATANGASQATSTFNVPGNYTIAFTAPPPATMPAAFQTSIYATLPGANASGLYINYTLSCGSTAMGACGGLNQASAFDPASYWQDTSGDPVTYYSPAQPPPQPVVITASLAQASNVKASASITIQAPATPPETISLTNPTGQQGVSLPNSISVSHAVMIGADVTNDVTYSGVNWSISCTDTAGTGCGTLSAAHSAFNTAYNASGYTGTYPLNAGIAYTAPAKVPSGGTVTITAASTIAPSVTASQTFTINPANSLGLNGLLEGQFAFVLSGRDTFYDKTTANKGGYYAIAGSLIGDGQGNVSATESDTMYFNLGVTPLGCGYGTYAIGSNGHGQITMTTCEPFSTLDVDFIDSDHAVLTEADGFGTGTGMLIRQNLNDVATALTSAGLPLNGAYTLTLSGANRDNPTETLYLGGALTATPTSNGQSTETSFVADADYAGSTVTNVSAKTHPTLGSSYNAYGGSGNDAYGRMSLGSVDLGASIFKYGGSSIQPLRAYMVDKSHYLLIQDTDDFAVLSGYLTAQPASASISGGYAFTEAGVSTSSTAMAAGGVFTCGSTGAMDVTTQGGTPLNKESIQATCTSPTNGRGLISVTGTTGGISNFAAYPTLDMGLQLVEIDSDGPTGAGVAWPQQSSAISASTLSGVYANDLLVNNTAGLESIIAPILADGVSSVSSTSGSQEGDTSQLTLSTSSVAVVLNTPLTGTFSADASGRFSGALKMTGSTLGTEYYVADASHVLLTTTDAANPGTGVMRRQSLPLIMVAPTQLAVPLNVLFNSGTAIGANGGTPPYSFSATNLPAGLSIAPATGVISGTPTAAGTYAVTVTVTDAASNVSSATFNMGVQGPITMQFASGSGPFGLTAQLPPSIMQSNSTIYLAAVTEGDYSGAGVDWSATCSNNGAPISGCDDNNGILYSWFDYTGHTDSFGTAGSYDTIAELDAYGFQPGTILTVTATSTADPTKSVSANITLVQQTPTVAIQGVKTNHNSVPSYVVVNKSIQLVATVADDPLNAGVTWSASCGAQGACGTLSNEHTVTAYGVNYYYATYTAPASVPGGGGAVTITASSITDPTAAAQASIPIDAKLPADGLINGDYVLLAKGLDTNGYLLTLAGTIVGDGNGNIYDGNVFASDAPGDFGNKLTYPVTLNSSTYSFGLDGRGTLTLAGGSNWSSGYGATGSIGVNGNLTFSVTFVTSTHALISESDGFGNATGTLDFQNASDLAAFQVYYPGTGLNGTYSLVASGAQSNPDKQFFLGGAMTFTFTPDSNHGGITTETSAVGDESINGVVTANTAAASLPVTMDRTYMKPDDYGHMFGGEYDYAVQVGPASVYMGAYMIDASHFAVIGVTSDGKNNFAGYLVAQPASPTLSGTYGFTENGASATAAPLAMGGIFTCGSTGVLDVVAAGTATTNQPINAACANPTTAGRGTIAISGTGSTNVGSFAAYPTVDSTIQLIELDGGAAGASGPVGAGVAYPQTAATPIAASVFDGSYGSNFANNGSGDDLSFVGLLTADGSSSLTGTVDENTFQISPATATPTTGETATGSFNANTNGRFTGSLSEIAPSIINGAFYVLSDDEILFVETDSATPGTGALESQQLPQLQ